jgi:hypothetical protein
MDEPTPRGSPTREARNAPKVPIGKDIHGNWKLRGQGSTQGPKSLNGGLRSTSRRSTGGFGGNIERGEAPTLLRERLEVRLDEVHVRIAIGVSRNSPVSRVSRPV